jgi:peptidoglycan/xylan/chitin deacetylase (PgdA/CDA1 family)
MTRNGIFIISLDFELHWGGFDKWTLKSVAGSGLPASPQNPGGARAKPGTDDVYLPVDKLDYKNYFLNTREVIPEMLTLFAAHETHVTWATVGILFHKDKISLLNHAPQLKPAYEEQQLSAYHYMVNKGIGEDEESDPFHFAPSLVKKILATPFQELATHTFAHYYCNEAGQTPEQFRADLKAAVTSAALFGVELKSLVFPRNQFNADYLKVCYEEGITSVRTNPLDWFWKIDSTQSESMWKRLNRGLDAYFPVGQKNTYLMQSLKIVPGLPLFIPASRLLRPYNPKEYYLNTLKIDRIKGEITRAAKAGEVYHLWWHPHNFGAYPKESLSGLKEILNHYDHCKREYGMQSLSMGEIANQLTGNPAVRETGKSS